MMNRRINPLFLIVLAFLLPMAGSAEEDPIDFAREVLPILSNKCFVCHGPDAEEDEVRLDSFEGATADLGGYKAIDPDAPEQSELFHRIHDTEDPMPPSKSEKQLTLRERDVLSRWAKSGGAYTKHWAFVRPEKTHGEKAGVDFFVEERLKKEGFKPAVQASPDVLARRAALVLTGLPPEPEQLNRFLTDKHPNAYGKLIDELLASSRFGEHQARYWLDAVRYGDTHGLHLDNRRGIYPYRDWVVKTFNDNLPFDEFITLQLAGDLLPDPSLEQLVATGYVRMNPTTSEGGAIPAEFQAKNNFDRTENLGTVFLGMTLNCARCHTHKFDPITQQEYYELLAFFNSTAESPMDGNAYIYAPVLEVPSNKEGWKKWGPLESKRSAFLAKTDKIITSEGTLDKAIAYASKTLAWKSANWLMSKPVSMGNETPDKKDWKPVKGLPGKSGERLGKNNEARWVSFDLTLPIAQSLVFKTNAGSQSHISVAGIDGKQTGTLLRFDLPAGTHQVLVKTQGTDGRTRTEIRLINPWEALAKSKKWEACSIDDRILMASDVNAGIFDKKLSEEAISLSEQTLQARRSFTTTLVAKELPKPRETKILERGEYNQPVGEPLQTGVFAVMNSFPEGAPKNRLGLAKWLTSRDHPLVARVLVNRFWQSVFGEGLVRSPEDFGLQGRQPTHPGLLDWLAVDFQESGWNYKGLMKKIVMSKTFRQDSAWRKDIKDPENLFLARGPSYRLDAEVIRDTGLWAGGLLRTEMGGEGVKPYQPEGLWVALAHPGSNTKNYIPDQGDQVYRRSLYVYWKRTSPHPMMTLFDAPSRESSCVRRSRGNTPLQSLGLFNEPQRMEMSQALAARLIQDTPGENARLEAMFNRLACRPPTDVEKGACLTLLKKTRDRYRKNTEEARNFIQLKGEMKTEDLINLAAWTQLATTILASDTTILLY